jgi:putative hydrolase of the HAD superfamily
VTDRKLPTPKFLYFDLGNVLLFFDHRRACRQLADLTGLDAQRIWDVIFATGLELEYEAGRLSSREVHQRFLRETGSSVDFDSFARACSDIFEVNIPVKAVLAQLAFCGYRLGVLSNTNEMHWRLLTDGRYALISGVFEQLVLSYEVGAVKPEPAIFQAAARKAGLQPAEIFYVDDIPGHVEGARSVGFDAVQYIDAPDLVSQLRQRGIALNY